jgi:hypothetical protein
MMEAINFSETWVLKRATRLNIPANVTLIATAVNTSNFTTTPFSEIFYRAMARDINCYTQHGIFGTRLRR